jgi:hypothetical protein
MRFCCSLFFCRFFQAQNQTQMLSLACLLTEWKSLCLILPPETITMNRRQINGSPPPPPLFTQKKLVEQGRWMVRGMLRLLLVRSFFEHEQR